MWSVPVMNSVDDLTNSRVSWDALGILSGVALIMLIVDIRRPWTVSSEGRSWALASMHHCSLQSLWM